MPSALILGGTGAIGRATAGRLAASGWAVTITGRDPARMPGELTAAGVRFVAVGEGNDPPSRAMASSVDLLVDCICFTAHDATRLLPAAHEAGSTVMISTKAVYVDDEGRHSNSDEPPDYGGPIPETQPTLAPSTVDPMSRTGYGANKVAAEQVLLDSGLPVTIIRPSKIHGPGSRQPREWVFVKRVLDRRPGVFLANHGAGVDHPSAAANIAALIETVSGQPGRRILNSADPDAPTVQRIARTVAGHLGHTWREILLDGDQLGRSPWDRKPPVTLDLSAALALGYQPVGDYASTVVAELDWLVDLANGGPDAELLPAIQEDLAPFFDYDAEDRYLEKTP
jgi:nucleoside-diphosphate-sugar epimerase